MGSSKKQPVGFRYFFRIHMGWCRGPVDELVEIKVGDRTALSGSATTSSTVQIAAGKLFGGDKAEGGIEGPLQVMMGEATQAVNPSLAGMHGGTAGTAPAFRGVFTTLFDGLVTSNNPYPKVWKARVRRALMGWDGAAFHPSKAIISLAGDTVKAMNGAHILYEAWTNRDWGRGASAARLDAAAFTAVADTLHAEGFGLCFLWDRQDSIKNFMQIVLDHIGAAQFPSRTTGLVKLKLIRNDYVVGDLPLFTPDTGLLGLDDDDNAATGPGLNQIIVRWKDPVTNTVQQIKAQNLALINSVGAVHSDTRDYLGLPTAELAARIAQRDLANASGGLKRFKVRLDRRGYQIEPGGVFRISAPERGIAEMVLRAGRIEDGEMGAGTITITAVQDVFGMPATSFVGVQPPGWTPPNTTPAAITTRGIMEIPYRDLAGNLSSGDLAALASTAGYLAAWGARPTPLSLNYILQTRVGAAAYADRGIGDFPPNGLLVAAMVRSATPVAITLSDFVDLDAVVVGTAALIDNEILRVDSINPTTGAVTLARGCADTLPASHALGARVWFYDGYPAADPTEYASGVTVNARLVTHTSSGDLDPALAGVDSLLMAQRQYRPYPPGKLRINTATYPETITGALALAWAHRDRLLQDDQLLDADYASVGPEPGQTYTGRFYGETDTLLRTVSGLAGASRTWTEEEADSGLSIPDATAAYDYDAEVLADSPVGYWRLNESSGTAAADGSGNGLTGTYTGGYTLGQSGPPNVGPAVLLNGSSGYTNLGAPAALNLTAAWHLEAWVYLTATPNGAGVIAEQYAGSGNVLYELGFGLSALSANLEVGYYTGSAWRTVAGGALSLNAWHLVGGEYNGTNLKLFVDGTQVATNAPASAPAAGISNAIWLGRRHDNSGAPFFPGRLAAAAIYPSAIGLARHQAHYTAGTAVATRLNNRVRIELESMRDGLASRQKYNVATVRVGYGYSYGYSYGGL